MISLPHPVRVFLHTPATDLRKGFDALCGLVTTAFSQDPTSGHLFLFVNRRRDRIKILYWDRDGLAIWYKRLEIGSFQIPTNCTKAVSIEMTATQLSLILSGIDLGAATEAVPPPRAGGRKSAVSLLKRGVIML
jgi:transposase